MKLHTILKFLINLKIIIKIYMKSQEIQERNKQIAFMLGWEEATLEYKLKWCAVPTEERLNKIDPQYVPILMKENEEPRWEDSLTWHSDWNQLMSVVEFIENIKTDTSTFEFHIQPKSVLIKEEKNYCFEKGDGGKSSQPLKINGSVWINGKTKKEAIFLAVSDFAKLYNENKIL